MRASLAAAIAVLSMVVPAVPEVKASGLPFASVAMPRGASKFVAVAPTRLADTRPGFPYFGGYTRLNANTIRVDIQHRLGVPTDATAAVLNVTIAGSSAATVTGTTITLPMSAFPPGLLRSTQFRKLFRTSNGAAGGLLEGQWEGRQYQIPTRRHRTPSDRGLTRPIPRVSVRN